MMNRKRILFSGILLIAFLLCYWSTVTGLVHVWTSDDNYSYVFLIPFISAYVIWERRKDIAEVQIDTNWLGGLPFILFLLISAYGIMGSSPSAVRPAMPFVVLSLTLFCFGSSFFRIFAFPLSFLFFMIPLPTIVQTWIGLPLKAISTKLGEIILRISGIPVFVEGNIIDLGVMELQVVDACSGLRYILPLFALGIIFAHFFEKVRWKKIVLAIMTIPIAIITNGFRIGMTGILIQAYGQDAAMGFFHSFSGWLIFIFAFALLFVFHSLMKKFFKVNSFNSSASITSEQKPGASRAGHSTIPLIASSLLLTLVGILSISTSHLSPMGLRDGLAQFPLAIGDWKAQSTERISSDIIEKSGAEDVFTAVYSDGEKNAVSLYVGYRGSPFLESENFFHSPNVCIPSSGWNVLQTRKHRISGVPHFGNIPVSEMVIEKTGYRQLVYFWFQTKSRVSHNVNINRYHLSLHAIMRDNTYDVFIRPISQIYEGETIEDAEKRMDQFVREMMPILLQFLKPNPV